MDCQSCVSSNLHEFLNLGYHPPTSVFTHSRSSGPKTLYPLVILRCDSCGLVQSGYATDPEVLFGGEYFYESSATSSFKKHQEDLANRMMKELNPKFVVDIGGNDGTALLPYQKEGIKVLNVDPSDVARKAKVLTINEFFSDDSAAAIEIMYGQADLITAFNVFAHVANLDSLMKGISRLLKPDGVFLTESKYLVDIVQKLNYDAFYLEALRFYSLQTLVSLLGRWGFEVYRAERIPPFDGSIRTFAKKILMGSSRQIDSSVISLLNLEAETGLQYFETYADLARRVKQNKADLNALLWKLKKEGSRIVGIGAPGRSTTIINYCALGPDLIDYLVETNPRKIGRYSPGTEILVVDETRLLQDQPEYAVNFLWYLPEIASKLRAKGYKGHLIVPLPEVKILE